MPTLVITGDQDEPCIEPSLFETPARFNREAGEFHTAVENRRWGTWTA